MRFIKKQLSLWRVVLIIGGSAIAIPIAARVSPTAIAVHKERQDYLDQRTTADNEDANDSHSNDSKAAVGEGVALPQDLLYDRRSRYWDQRVLRRLESLDEDEDNNAADAKDSKADKDDGDDEDFSIDKDKEDELVRRREYWSKRLDDEW
jgi:hypothetical protein